MKILTIGNFTTGWDGSICDEEHIAKALEELGHEVIRRQREEDYPVGLRGGGHIYDFVLIAQWDGYSEDLLTHKKLRYENMCGPIVYWAFDYQADGQEWHERLIEGADLYLSKRIADSKYPNWRWLSQDFAPKFLDKHPYPLDKTIDVLFTGSYLPWATERNETLKAVDEQYHLVIHSFNSWPTEYGDVRGPIMDDGLPELYAKAKVILSIDHTIEAGYWSDRNAQIIVCGEKPLFRHVDLSEIRFTDNVEYFYNIDDCLKKINQRLTYPNYLPVSDTNMRVIDRVRDLLIIVGELL